jgi:hypothetical protein
MGAPVDLATMIANLGIAGGGYLAHKTGLIDQPPDLLDPKSVPLSSDWHVKNSPLEDTGSSKYFAGRTTANLFPALLRAAAKAPRPRHGQVSALYPGGSDDLVLTHSTKNKIPKEIGNLSGAITKDNLNTDFGSTVLVLNPSRFEPRTSPTVIKNRDFFSPRYSDSREDYYAQRKKPDDVLWELAMEQGVSKKVIKDFERRVLANARLADRFYPTFSNAGTDLELVSRRSPPENWPTLPSYGRGGNGSADLLDPRLPEGAFDMAKRASPRFQSFKHYENSPYGGKLLTNDPRAPLNETGDIEETLRRFFADNGLNVDTERAINIANKALTRPELDSLDKIQAQKLREIVRRYKSVPSNYAETKTFGPTPLNKETVAGVLVSDHDNNATSAVDWARRMGVPYQPGDLQSPDMFELAVQLQNYARNRR